MASAISRIQPPVQPDRRIQQHQRRHQIRAVGGQPDATAQPNECPTTTTGSASFSIRAASAAALASRVHGADQVDRPCPDQIGGGHRDFRAGAARPDAASAGRVRSTCSASTSGGPAGRTGARAAAPRRRPNRTCRTPAVMPHMVPSDTGGSPTGCCSTRACAGGPRLGGRGPARPGCCSTPPRPASTPAPTRVGADADRFRQPGAQARGTLTAALLAGPGRMRSATAGVLRARVRSGAGGWRSAPGTHRRG